MKAFVDDKKKKERNTNVKSNPEFRWIENIVVKRRKSDIFKNLLSRSRLKSGLCGKELKITLYQTSKFSFSHSVFYPFG